MYIISLHLNQLRSLICLFLAAIIMLAFWQVQYHDFVIYDDNSYVTENDMVQKGLTTEGIAWAFSAPRASNWHPLTWLSLMLDSEIYGLWPGGYHWTNLIFHIANTVLLFLVFHLMTGALWRSCFVAALFAIHPLHVESVAWVAERKDVLSTFFWMIAMGSYVYYVKRPGLLRYLIIIFTFTLGLLSKPMVVTLPFVLLLLDFWPLNRIDCNRTDFKRVGTKLIIEKIPLMALSVIASVITFLAQKGGGAVAPLSELPFMVRISNAIVSYILYIYKFVWPVDLAVLYPHPGMLPLWIVIVSALVIVSVTVVSLWQIRRYPYAIIGWLWYLGTLVPVIGIVQVGSQAMADRYTYIPLIGIMIVLTWGFYDLLKNVRQGKQFLCVTGAVVIGLLVQVTLIQVRHWENSKTLFRHTDSVTTRNYMARNILGGALMKEGNYRDAIGYFRSAMTLKPDFKRAVNNLGYAFSKLGNEEEAVHYYKEALKIDPDYADAHYNLGIAFTALGKYDEALSHLRRAADVRPRDAAIYNNMGIALMKAGRNSEALQSFADVVHIDPGHAGAHNNMAMILLRQKRWDEAIAHFRGAVRIQPRYANAHYHLAIALQEKGLKDEADDHFAEAIEINPAYKNVHGDMINDIYEDSGRPGN